MDSKPTPKVFVSYSWTTEEHKKWVLDLSTRLRSEGVDVVLDRFHLEKGHDKYAFMERMVTDTTIGRVLIVSDRLYAEKADGRAGGVGTETQIVTPEVYGKVDQTKFIPLLRERTDTGQECLPTYLKSRVYVDFSDDEKFEDGYDELIRLLHNAPELVAPPIGKPPAHIFVEKIAATVTESRFRRLKNAVEAGKQTASAFRREYLDALYDAFDALRDRGPLPPDTAVDERIIDSIGKMRPYRDEFVEFCVLYANHFASDDEAYADTHGFMARLLTLTHSAYDQSSCSEWQFDAQRYTNREIILYLLAVLIKYRRYKLVARLMDDSYQYSEPHGNRSREVSIGEYDDPANHLEGRKSRLKLNIGSVTADLVKEHSTYRAISFRQLVHVDLLLLVRGVMIGKVDPPEWFPRLYSYALEAGPLEVLAKANTSVGMTAVKELFGAKDVRHLASLVERVMTSEHIAQRVGASRWFFMGRRVLPEVMNWSELQQHLPSGR